MSVTEIYHSPIPLLAVLVSLLAVPLILFSTRKPNLREFWTISASLIKFGLVLTLLPGALAGQSAAINLFELAPGINLALKADAFGVFLARLRTRPGDGVRPRRPSSMRRGRMAHPAGPSTGTH